jgi:hypothetical protein
MFMTEGFSSDEAFDTRIAVAGLASFCGDGY